MQIEPGTAVEPPPLKKPNLSLMPDRLVCMARGFSCIFWALPLGLLLFSSFPDFRFYRLRVPSFLTGILLFYWGMMLLRRAGWVTPRWAALVRHGVFASFLQVFLGPFVYWWRQAPDLGYYLVNAFFFLASVFWGLWLIGRLSEETGHALHDTVLEAEAFLCRWGVFLLIAIPALAIAGLASWSSWQYEVRFSVELVRILQVLPVWASIPFLLAYSLVMAIAWKTKNRCFHALRWSARIPALPPVTEPEG